MYRKQGSAFQHEGQLLKQVTESARWSWELGATVVSKYVYEIKNHVDVSGKNLFS